LGARRKVAVPAASAYHPSARAGRFVSRRFAQEQDLP
jgi:hypothetical protein